MPIHSTSRRAFLRLCLSAPLPVIVAACSGQPASAPTAAPATAAPATSAPATSAPATAIPATSAPAPTALPATATAPPATPVPTTAAVLLPTPACDDGDEPTIAQTEGPYFTPNSPERTSLIEAGITGTKIILSGLVLSTSCAPLARVLIDVWHADDSGNYDNVGYKLRGHLFSDDQGRYQLETIVPGLYPGRTRHFHVKVQAANQPVLTTQLYFPDEPGNAQDGIYDARLLLDIQDGAGSKTGRYDFVLDV